MTQQELLSEFLSLPTEGQRLVEDLITSLKQKTPPAPPSETATAPGLSCSSFIGMWKDRADLADSAEWVREVRRNEW
jgi:hypothetical protein